MRWWGSHLEKLSCEASVLSLFIKVFPGDMMEGESTSAQRGETSLVGMLCCSYLSRCSLVNGCVLSLSVA